MQMIFRLIVAGLCWPLVVCNVGRAAVPPEPVLLWPGEAPGEKGGIGEEKDSTKPTDGKIAGQRLIRLGNVSKPTLTVYPAPKEKATGAAVVVCPGGGYHILAMDLEGTEVVEWLNSIGVTAVLLKYRVPVRAERPRYEAPLQDAQRAIRLVRARAVEYGLETNRIGIMGFSAGAHLSAVTSCRFDQSAYAPIDAVDQQDARPNFVMLIYPAYLTLDKQIDQIAPELTMTPKTPPTFLVQTEDDPIRVEGSLFYYLALKKAGVRSEMHLYATGGHGYGLRATEENVTKWPGLAQQWLRQLGMTGRAK